MTKACSALLDEIVAWDRASDLQTLVSITAHRLATLLGKARVTIALRPVAGGETAQASAGESGSGRPRLVFSRRLAAGKVACGMLEAEIIEPGRDLPSSLTLLDAVAGRLALEAEEARPVGPLAA